MCVQIVSTWVLWYVLLVIALHVAEKCSSRSVQLHRNKLSSCNPELEIAKPCKTLSGEVQSWQFRTRAQAAEVLSQVCIGFGALISYRTRSEVKLLNTQNLHHKARRKSPLGPFTRVCDIWGRWGFPLLKPGSYGNILGMQVIPLELLLQYLFVVV